MESLNLELLTAASAAGGPSCLSSTTHLRPAAGPHASVAPAKFAARGRDGGAYAYEKRFLDGRLRHTVVIDSKQSQLNRAEAALVQGIEDGDELLTRVPRILVRYAEGDTYLDLTLPHRAFDGHIRAGTLDGTPTTQTDAYRALRDAGPANARALLEASPATLIFGGWDSSRRSRQGRWRSALVGEITGFLAGDGMTDQRPEAALRGGARVDPVGMQIQVDGPTLRSLTEDQRAEMSPKTVEGLLKEAGKLQKPGQVVSASALGLGGIPPTLESLAGVACDQIIRSHVLSFATLRQMRFGAGPEGDAACRALLAALALTGLARSDAELYLRANCDLVEAGPSSVQVDRRHGDLADLEPLDVGSADTLLADALKQAERMADVRWNGVVLDVVGNPAIRGGAVEAEDEAG